jgi:Ca-activated chloride channel family protein
MMLTLWGENNMSAQQTNIFTEFTQAVSDFIAEGLSFDGVNFEGMLNNFHFIRPWWLLAFFALFLVLFLLKKIRYYQSPWQHFLPSHLANALLENSHNQSSQTAQPSLTKKAASSQTRYLLKPSVIGSCIILALAGPAWQKLPQPIYQLERGAVLIMDMSYSMYATDVKPNRLTRARYKAIDLLKKINEGDVGLIAYAGDAFIISPLTQDVKNIELLLPSLSPDIMPVPGANALAALILADQTLKNAGHISGDIYWFTDDIDNEEMSDVYDWANDNNHKVNILGVGSKTGAPIKLSSGKLLKDNRGAIVIPKLPESRLSAIAQRGRGVYQTMTNDDADIKALTAHLSVNLDDTVDAQASIESKSKQAMQGDQYQEQGPWLLLIILPLLLSYFRRGSSILAISWLMPLTLLFSFTTFSPNSYAAEPNNSQNSAPSAPAAVADNTEANAESNGKPSDESNVSPASQLWQDLWKTSDQQAQQHYQQKDYQQAAKQFDDSQWQGSAHYKAGDYEQALQAFQQGDSAQALYNQGNSLAQLKKVDEAIEAYKKALEKDPNLEDAKDNLAKLEELKKQEEENKSSDDDKKEEGDKQDSQEKQDGESQSQDQSEEGQQQEGDESSQENQEQEQNQEKSQEQQDKEAKQSQESNDSEEDKKEEQSAQAKESDEEQQGEEKSLTQQAIDSKAQETEQKHQQLLNKVTDDPYLLLRNKMRLEYQKRRNEGASQGVTKKW